MKKILAISLFVLFASVAFGAYGGGYVKFSGYTYLSAGKGLTGESDTSDVLHFPEDLKTLTFFPLCDSGAANGDDDTVTFKLYALNPYGTYVFLDSLGDALGSGGNWADDASDSTGLPVVYHDSCWHYFSVQDDSVAADPTAVEIHGLGWLDKYTEFVLIFTCTDTTDLGAALTYNYATYSASQALPFGLLSEPDLDFQFALDENYDLDYEPFYAAWVKRE
jgi:hypothetical protein